MRIGFFGGTFDPIHFGHINLALRILEKKQLDRVLFCPAMMSPEKVDRAPSASAEDRLAMLKLAIDEIPNCEVIDNELQRPGPSYTIDTIRELKQESPEDEFFLITADDAASSLDKWKEVETLLTLAKPLVGVREGASLQHLPSSLLSTLEKGMVSIPRMDISSTELRVDLEDKKYCGHLVPTKVLDYIREKGIY